MTALTIIEQQLRKFGDLAVRLRPADEHISRPTFTCWQGGQQSLPVGCGDTLEEAYADLLNKQDHRIAA